MTSATILQTNDFNSKFKPLKIHEYTVETFDTIKSTKTSFPSIDEIEFCFCIKPPDASYSNITILL